jgi:hypothetical protein
MGSACLSRRCNHTTLAQTRICTYGILRYFSSSSIYPQAECPHFSIFILALPPYQFLGLVDILPNGSALAGVAPLANTLELGT